MVQPKVQRILFFDAEPNAYRQLGDEFGSKVEVQWRELEELSLCEPRDAMGLTPDVLGVVIVDRRSPPAGVEGTTVALEYVSALRERSAVPMVVVVQPGDVFAALSAMAYGAIVVLELLPDGGLPIQALFNQLGAWLAGDEVPERHIERDRQILKLWLRLPSQGIDLYEVLDQFESRMMFQALNASHGNKAQAARLLHLNRTTFVEKLKRKKIDDPDP